MEKTPPSSNKSNSSLNRHPETVTTYIVSVPKGEKLSKKVNKYASIRQINDIDNIDDIVNNINEIEKNVNEIVNHINNISINCSSCCVKFDTCFRDVEAKAEVKVNANANATVREVNKEKKEINELYKKQ